MKKCMSCGKEFPDNMKFCAACGSALTAVEEQAPVQESSEVIQKSEPIVQEVAPTVQEAEKSTNQQAVGSGITDIVKKLPPYVLPAVAAVIVVFVIIIAVCIGGKSEFTELSKNMIQIDYTDEGYICYTPAGDTFVFGDEDDNYDEVGSSADGAVKLIRGDDDIYYVLTIDSFDEIEEDIETAVISANGDGVAYISDVSSKLGDLYLYNVKKKSAEKIESDVYYRYFCISPDGKSVAFIGDYENSGEFEAYISISGKEAESIEKNSYPIAISNKGKYVYYNKYDGRNIDFYVASGSDSNKLASELGSSLMIFFNEDLSEIIYDADNETYFSKKGGEKERIKKSELYTICCPDNMTSYEYEGYGAITYILGRDSLEKTALVFEGDEIYYFINESEVEKIVSSYDQYVLSSDMKGLMYLDDDSVYRIKDMSKPEKEETLAEDIEVRTFNAVNDLSAFYYVDDEETLFYQKGDKEPKKIADDVYSVFALDRKENIIFYLVDYSSKSDSGELYYSKKGGKKTEVKDGSDVIEVYMMNDSVVMVKEEDDDEYNVYLAKKGTKFELIMEYVELWR